MYFPFGRRLQLMGDGAANPDEPHAPNAVIQRIENQDDLARLPRSILRMLRDEFDIGASSNRFCPLLFDDGSVAVVTVEAWQDSDQVEELERMVLRRHYRLARPSRLVVPATLLLALVRGQITGASLRNRHRVLTDSVRSSMAEAFHDMVAWGVEHEASDLHINIRTLAAESEVRFSIGGRYVAPGRFARMPTVTLMEILSVAWMDIQGGNGAVFDPMIEQQGRLRLDIKGSPIVLRWASLATDAGASVCLRILRLDAQIKTSFEELGYLPTQVATLDRARTSEGGAIILAGVVGSGKSTTIATMMGMIPTTRKVITLEDPVEYLIPGALQNTVTRQLEDSGRDVFDAKLKTVKRSAMNDLLVGEIRDRETGRAFMDLAGSGTSLYTTVHAGSAMLIPDRLASDFIGVSRDFLATPGILKLLVYQVLMPRLCGHCALVPEVFAELEGAHRWHYFARWFAELFEADPGGLRFRNPQGCAVCRARQLPELNGFDGRTVVAEMIEPAIDDVFLSNLRASDNISQRRHLATARMASYGSSDMRGKTAMACAVFKALQGQIDPREIEARFTAFESLAARHP